MSRLVSLRGAFGRSNLMLLLCCLLIVNPVYPRTRNLARRGITDVSKFKFKEGLTRLKLNRNKITDISPLELPSTVKHLNIAINKITNLNELQLNSNLTTLIAFNNQITTVDGLNLSHNLELITIGGNELADVYLLRLPNSLKELRLVNSDLDDDEINGLVLNENLEVLEIGFNNLTTISGISFNNSLRRFAASSNSFGDFEWNLLPESLEELRFIGNRSVTNFEDMVLPPNLKCLNLDVIFFDSFLFLNAKLPDSLEELTLDRCFVGTVEGLVLPPNLLKLELKHNNLTSFDLDLPDTMRDLDLRKNDFSRAEKRRIRAKYRNIKRLKIRL